MSLPFAVILIGAIVLIAAFNDTHAQLAHALEADIPSYFTWAIAIAAILGLGFIPGMRVPSRWLIALVALVIVLTNFQRIKDGFAQFAASGGAAGGAVAAEPTAAYVQSAGAGGLPTPQQIAGDAPAGAAAGAPMTAAQQLAANPLNPSAYTALASGFGSAAPALAAIFGG